MVRHLYVHIPFCPKVCPYCSFYKEAGDRNKTKAFLEALLAEAEMSAEGLRPETVFFGGGTPTALSTPQLGLLITGLRERLDFSAVREFTIEMNPATVSHEKATALFALGVNRVSMGVQSWDDRLLKTLGRVHSAAQARRSYGILRESGVGNINLDLIFGIPGQSAAEWRESLLMTLDLEPDHISAYCLTYEEDTEYFERFTRGEYAPEEGRDAEFFETAMDVLADAGFEQYEISNYARPGRECLHNLAYWQGADYAGLGPSAFSTCSGKRRRNIADTSEYIRRVENRSERHDFEELVPGGLRRSETTAFALRTKYGISITETDPKIVGALEANGLIEIVSRNLRLTRKGKLVADAVAAELL
ncbi:MAG: radical SAM family heme chaperone HemW [Terrimicrobiaceae bacterium]|nr:radical SAM family heme chaperone HemW [Terrimicrobiaceae bacterium]